MCVCEYPTMMHCKNSTMLSRMFSIILKVDILVARMFYTFFGSKNYILMAASFGCGISDHSVMRIDLLDSPSKLWFNS